MGSSQSAHKFTIVNDGSHNIIKISEDLAKRISRNYSEATDEAKLSETNNVITSHIPATKVYHSHEDADIYYPYYTVSALEVHQEKQKQLENQEEYWKNRMNNLKKNHDVIEEKLLHEYNQARQIFDNYKVKKIKNAGESCKMFEDSLYECYCNNQHKMLNCSENLALYAECINAHREKSMPFQ